jgi:uncharacterized protein YcbK (DUF882 family)
VQDNENRLELTRRHILGLGAGALVSLAATPSWALVHKIGERSLSFHHLNTSETLSVVYWAEGRYVPQGLHEINHLLRDYRTDEIKTIDPRLLDILFSLKYRLDTNNPFQVISGYRSPQTNAMLRRHSHSVAKNSLHMKGMAIDIRVKGHKPSQIARAAREMKLGGVGTYRRFVHLDAGDVRVWRG